MAEVKGTRIVFRGLNRVKADQVEGEKSADALAEDEDLPARVFPDDSFAKVEDVPLPDVEGIDMSPRPVRGPAESPEFDSIRSIAIPGQGLRQEIPTGRMGAEPVDQEKNGPGSHARRREVPFTIEDIGSGEFRHGRIITDMRTFPEGTS
jgi:hypothetical protein